MVSDILIVFLLGALVFLVWRMQRDVLAELLSMDARIDYLTDEIRRILAARSRPEEP